MNLESIPNSKYLLMELNEVIRLLLLKIFLSLYMSTDQYSVQMSSGERFLIKKFGQGSKDGSHSFFRAPNEEIFKLICSLLKMRIEEINKLDRRFRDCNRFEITGIRL